jgi:hypothetical protein
MNSQNKESLSNLNSPFRGVGGEKLLQFIWQFGYFNKSNLTTIQGEELSITSVGTLNKNQGPDFINGRIKIGTTTLAGAIELHLKTSDWKKHRHEKDENYKNVILHVVFQHDEVVNPIPVLELEPRVSKLLLQTYNSFMENASFIACSNSIKNVRELTWISWKERLLVERLQRKSIKVLLLLEQSANHWEETFWWTLARAFGSKINGDAFEAIAHSISINILAKHKSSVHQIESLLFGQAGLLNDDFTDDYPQLLQREYNFLRKKYNLQPSSIPVLFLRMRPGNFPTIRLAQLAVLIQTASHLFSKIIEAEKLAQVKTLFQVTANDFWHYHYTFNQATSFKKKTLGSDTIDNLIINTVSPMLFAYGTHHNEDKYKEKALRWLEQLPAETNTITKGFFQLEVMTRSAYDSQALIELKNEYCSPKKCLDCSVGNYLLREAAAEYVILNKLETSS